MLCAAATDTTHPCSNAAALAVRPQQRRRRCRHHRARAAAAAAAPRRLRRRHTGRPALHPLRQRGVRVHVHLDRRGAAAAAKILRAVALLLLPPDPRHAAAHTGRTHGRTAAAVTALYGAVLTRMVVVIHVPAMWVGAVRREVVPRAAAAAAAAPGSAGPAAQLAAHAAVVVAAARRSADLTQVCGDVEVVGGGGPGLGGAARPPAWRVQRRQRNECGRAPVPACACTYRNTILFSTHKRKPHRGAQHSR